LPAATQQPQQQQQPQQKTFLITAASVNEEDFERMAADLKRWQHGEREKQRLAQEEFQRQKAERESVLQQQQQQQNLQEQERQRLAAAALLNTAPAMRAPAPPAAPMLLEPAIPTRLTSLPSLDLSAHQRRVVAKCVDILLQACFERDPGRVGVLPLLLFHRVLHDVIAANNSSNNAAAASAAEVAPPPSHLLIAHFLHAHDGRKMIESLDAEKLSYLNFISWVLQL
jgi:hypothetical protein